jgi:hypothetical protein
MNEYLFNKRVEHLIKNSINHHLHYEEFHKSMYNTYEEYENPNTTKERRRELSKLMRKGDLDYDKYIENIEELGKHLNSHDLDIALRQIRKQIKNDTELWDDYFKWKSARSTMVV